MRTALTAVAVFTLSACQGLVGSGNVTTQSRQVGAFSRVSINSGLTARVVTGARSVTVRADDNLISEVETVVEGDTLVARLPVGTIVLGRRTLEVLISNDLVQGVVATGASEVTAAATPTTEFVANASGASQLTITGLSSSRVAAGASGASRVILSGVATSATLTDSGASTMELQGLPLQSATLDVSGASSLRAAVSESLSGAVSGASTVVITGTPGGDVSVSGGSRLTRGAP